MTRAGLVELEKEEEVIVLQKRAFFWPMRRVVASFILALLPFVLIFPALSLGVMGMSIYAALTVLAIWNTIRFYLARHFSMLIVTDKRIIDVDQRGIIGREIIEIPISAIEEVHVLPQGFFARKLRIGGVKIISGDEAEYDIIFSPVKSPQILCELIEDVRKLQENDSVLYETSE